MRIYRTDREGIAVFRISGIVERKDAAMLLQFLGHSPGSSKGSFILDFQGVEHVDYHVFEMFEEWFSGGSGVLLSGLSDYILDIFAFVNKKNVIPIFSDWRKALHFLIVERGKMGAPAAISMIGNG